MRQLFEELERLTYEIDKEVEQGFDLSRFRDRMAFLHALQLQAQILIDQCADYVLS